MVTMNDVAKAAGVSQATVSRVINGNPSVGQTERRRVMECVRDLGYKPNIMARSLGGSKTNLIGVVIPDVANPFFAEIVNAIEKSANTYGYSVILCNTEYDIERERKSIDVLKSYRIDGLVVVPSDKNAESFQRLKRIDIPVVVVTQDVHGFTSISVSHYDAGEEVAKHFLDSGCTRFIYIGTPNKLEAKGQGFKDYIKQSGFDLEKSLKILDKNKISESLTALLSQGYLVSPVGVFVKNDIDALNTMHVLKDLGVKIPEDVLLVGFDNTFFSKYLNPTLSTVAQPTEMIGTYAIENLVDKIGGRKKDERHLILAQRLIVRESSMKQALR